MALYLTVRAGDDPASALPILATTDSTVIRTLIRVLAERMDVELDLETEPPLRIVRE